MTREEAIRGLTSLVEVRRKYFDMQTMKDEIECLDIAIKALEQERSRSAEITQYRHDCEKLMEENERLNKALAQEPCEDAISRQEVNKLLRDIWVKYMPMELDVNLSFVLGAIDEIESVTPARPKSEWIPVSKRLPEEDGCYLVTTTGTNNDIIDIAYYTDGIWHKASRIKAWMPLPQPYKAESEGTE